MDLLLVREEVVDLAVAGVEELRDVLNGEAFILRHRDVADGPGLDGFLPHRHDVLEEVNGDLLVRRQVDASIDGQEVVHLALALVLGGELLRGDLLGPRHGRLW